MFQGLGNLASLMRQAPVMLGKMQAINDELRSRRTAASVGGGLVEVEVNGLGEVQRVSLDPALVERGDREMLEELLVAAFNQAQAKANQLRAESMQSMAEGMDIPGLNEALSQLADDPDKA